MLGEKLDGQQKLNARHWETDGRQMACDRIDIVNDRPFGSIVLPLAAVRLVEKLIASGKAARVYMTASRSKATLFIGDSELVTETHGVNDFPKYDSINMIV